MTVTEIPSKGFMRVRMGATTEHRGYREVEPDPVPVANVRVIVDQTPTQPSDDNLMRGYVSNLWAEDWDSAEDAVYDTW